jgi:16S rRNA (adenine1518-N6/adenine1519-N6)-dimethyltransferase
MSRLLEETKKTLKENNLVPKKSLGQNFLIDEVYLKKIIEASQIKNDEILVEIGAGLGTLTKELAKRAKRVIAIEKDEKLINVLKKILQKEKINNIELIQGDILKIKLPILDTQQYKVIGNSDCFWSTKIHPKK